MINFWRTCFDNAFSNVARGTIISVTTTTELRRDRSRTICRDGARNPIETGVSGNPGSDLNRLCGIEESLFCSGFAQPSRQSTPQKSIKSLRSLVVLSGWVTPDNALHRRYRTCSKSSIPGAGKTRPITSSVTQVGALPQARRPGTVHNYFVRFRSNRAATGQTWRIA
jgi:hypothetical protein